MAVSGNDGRLYLLDALVAEDAALRHAEIQQCRRDWRTGDLENEGTRWILAPAVGGSQGIEAGGAMVL